MLPAALSKRILKPGFLSYMASHDVASDMRQALPVHDDVEIGVGDVCALRQVPPAGAGLPLEQRDQLVRAHPPARGARLRRLRIVPAPGSFRTSTRTKIGV